MIARWCISTFIFLLTLFGVVSQQQIVAPNQEIVLQFTDVELTSDDAKQTILIVKEQLEGLGVRNIQIKAQENGKLKISYYCDVDISNIKEVFIRKHSVILDYQSENKPSREFPSEDQTIAYNIKVYEIQSSNNSDWNLEGTFTLEVEAKSDRFSDPNSYSSTANFDICYLDNIVKVVYKNRSNISIEVGDTLHKIPEVRAGPFC